MEAAGIPVNRCIVDHGEKVLAALLTPDNIRCADKNTQIFLLCLAIWR